MEITPASARESLLAADAAVKAVKLAIDRQTSRIVLMWGTVYVLAPLSMHLWQLWGLIPLELLLVGAIAYTIFDTSRNSPISSPNSWRIGALWWLTFGFGAIWFLILGPVDVTQFFANGDMAARSLWAYGVSLAMFVYVVMGLWIGWLYLVTGLGVTLLTLFGLFWLGDWYWLWCSATGGGALLAAGLWLRRQGPE